MEQIRLSDIQIDVIHKDIKNLHLSVHPPTGKVRISAPLRMSTDSIRVFAISKLGWIRKHQNKFNKQNRETSREYINRESHYYLGKRMLLKVTEHDSAPNVVLRHNRLEMNVRPNSTVKKRQAVLESWYRQKLKEIIPKYITSWEKVIGVTVNEFAIKKMKTKWGTCNNQAKRIWLNLELAKKPIHCVEYIIVHEMVHLLEKHHNRRFIAYMDRFMPQWRFFKEELNRFPLSHTEWKY